MRLVRTVICSVWIASSMIAAGDLITFSDINQTVPDNDPMGVQNTQVLTGYDSVLTSLNVYICLSGVSGDLAFAGDYYVSLQHESGFSVLLNRVGVTAENAFGYDDNGFNLTFSDDEPNVHSYQDGVYSLDEDDCLTGTWGVDGRVTDPDSVLDTDTPSAFLDSFAGVDPNGSWTLFVADMSMNGVGEIKSWGLDISATVPEPAALSILLLGIVLLWGFHRVKKNSYSQVSKR